MWIRLTIKLIAEKYTGKQKKKLHSVFKDVEKTLKCIRRIREGL